MLAACPHEADVEGKKKCKLICPGVLHTSSSVVSAHNPNDESVERKLLITLKGRQDRSFYIFHSTSASCGHAAGVSFQYFWHSFTLILPTTRTSIKHVLSLRTQSHKLSGLFHLRLPTRKRFLMAGLCVGRSPLQLPCPIPTTINEYHAFVKISIFSFKCPFNSV